MSEPVACGVTVAAEALRAVVRAVVECGGSSEREARLVAEQLVEANLTGHDSHGVGMLPRYVEALAEGGLRVNRNLTVRTDAGPLLMLDGNAGYGQVMAFDAMMLGIERAAEHGVAVVGLANSHHIGRVGHWAEQCVAAGYVSIHFANVIAKPVVAPFGGSDARFVTNPFCVGIPMPGGEPILLDFATSRIAMGKVRVAFNKGERVKPETLLDSSGEPTTDPGALFAEPGGAILPFGEHKGYGMAVVCEILGGALAGGLTLHERPRQRAIINNMLTFIVDPQRLGTAERLAREAMAFADWVRASPPMQGVDRVRLAGEPERESRLARGAAGIPIDATTWKQIVGAAEQLGLGSAEVHRIASTPPLA
jgi:hydroxycarboxylate dehydrogenase B